jgi:short-subunit dehydrogenase
MQKNERKEMKKILITGARDGIGLDVTKRLLEKGYVVYATVHYDADVASLKEKLSEYGKRAVVDKLDILDESDRNKVKNWDIDILINNAAIGDSGPLAEIPVERVREVIETNVIATLQLTQQVLVQMKEKDNGRIIFISSLAGFLPTPFISPYALTKHALESVAGSLRYEVRSLGIKIITINPGGYDTGFNKKMIEKKYAWLDEDRLDKREHKTMKQAEKLIYFFEQKSTATIAKKIVKAVEVQKPARRYVAPWWQGVGVYILRLFN